MKRPSIIIDPKLIKNKNPDLLKINSNNNQPQFSFTKQERGSSVINQEEILDTSQVLETQNIMNISKNKFSISQIEKQAKFQIMELVRSSSQYKQMIKNSEFMEQVQSILGLNALNLTEIFENFTQIMKKVILFSSNHQKQKVIFLSKDQRIKLKITQETPKISKRDSKLQQENKKVKLQNVRLKEAYRQLQLDIVKISQQFKKKKERYKTQIQKLTDILKCSFLEAGKKFIYEQFTQSKPKVNSKTKKIPQYQQKDSDIQDAGDSQNRGQLDFDDYNFNILKAKNITNQENPIKSQIIQMKRNQSQKDSVELTKRNNPNPLRSTQSNIFMKRQASDINKFNSVDDKFRALNSKLQQNQSPKNSLKTMKISNVKSQDQNFNKLGNPKFGNVYKSQIGFYQ